MSEETSKPVQDFNFDLEERTFPITIAKERYLIVEASALAASKAKDVGTQAVRFETKGGKTVPVGFKDGVAQSELVLVSQCLFKLGADDTRIPVPLATVQGWQDRIVRPIYLKIREISGMDDEDTGKN